MEAVASDALGVSLLSRSTITATFRDSHYHLLLPCAGQKCVTCDQCVIFKIALIMLGKCSMCTSTCTHNAPLNAHLICAGLHVSVKVLHYTGRVKSCHTVFYAKLLAGGGYFTPCDQKSGCTIILNYYVYLPTHPGW